jgi:GR25 family glycosyltransferase involved in LPS biosynthesis
MKINAFVINLVTRPERLAEFKKIDFPFEVKVHSAVKHTNGSIGCIQSHLDCFKQFDDGVNIIFEDDCQQINNLDVFYNALNELGNDWDVLYLGAIIHGETIKNTEHTHIIDDGWATHAIAYNGRKVANYLLTFTAEEIHIAKRNIDTFIVYNVQKNADFKCYITHPQIFIQRPSFSDIINKHRNYNL